MQSRLKPAKRSRFDWQSLRCELQILLKGRVDYLLAPIEFGDCVGGFKSGRRHPFMALERTQNELVRQPASIRLVTGSALFECPHACYRTDSLPAGRTNNKHGLPIELLRPAVEVLHRNGSEVPKLRIRLSAASALFAARLDGCDCGRRDRHILVCCAANGDCKPVRGSDCEDGL